MCNALVAGSRLLGVEQQAMCPECENLCDANFPHLGRIACCSTPNSRPPATKVLHSICGNNTSIVSSSWWVCECPKHVEWIIIAIKHSVASSWISSLRLYYDARTNIHQIHILYSQQNVYRMYTECLHPPTRTPSMPLLPPSCQCRTMRAVAICESRKASSSAGTE